VNKRSIKYLLPLLAGAVILSLSFGFDVKPEDVQFVRPDGWPKPVYDVVKNWAGSFFMILYYRLMALFRAPIAIHSGRGLRMWTMG
jgi:hypothetical protein